MLDKQLILSKTDHTLLKQDATEEDVRALCREAKAAHTASVCIPPRFVRAAREELCTASPKVCTVIGFALGYQTEKVKCFECADALENGADEIDMVIPAGEVKAGNYDAVAREIRALKALCGSHILKVIVETCLLTKEEKIALCRLVRECGADFIKTSTGFSAGGATVEDVRLFKATCPDLKVKASGGIRTLAFASELIEAGADRLGASALLKAEA